MNPQEFAVDRLMIIDDTQIDRYVASLVVKTNKFSQEILEFDMATKAISYLEENKDNPNKLPQVILLDINMPQMNGFEFLEKLESIPGTIPETCCIIMLTSSLSAADQHRASQIKAIKKFVNKPLNKNALTDIRDVYIANGNC